LLRFAALPCTASLRNIAPYIRFLNAAAPIVFSWLQQHLKADLSVFQAHYCCAGSCLSASLCRSCLVALRSNLIAALGSIASFTALRSIATNSSLHNIALLNKKRNLREKIS